MSRSGSREHDEAKYAQVLRFPNRRELARRLPPLVAGLIIMGLSISLSVRAQLGLAPWDVFHQGVADQLNLSIGVVVVLVGLVVLLAWIPLRQHLGFGTILNTLSVGFIADFGLMWIPNPSAMAARIAFLGLAIIGFGIGGGLYIGAGLGPGPRDGLMTAITARASALGRAHGHRVQRARGRHPARRQGGHRNGVDRAQPGPAHALGIAVVPPPSARRRTRGDGGVKVVVIGTGFGARVVAPAFAAADGCEVIEVVSPRDDAAIGTALARADVDLVSVHSPPFLHAAHVRAAFAAGKAVLCDKPFALDAREATALVDEAEAAGVIALCNFEFRFHPVRRLLRELVRTDALGPIEHVQWTHLSAGVAGAAAQVRVALRPRPRRRLDRRVGIARGRHHSLVLRRGHRGGSAVADRHRRAA